MCKTAASTAARRCTRERVCVYACDAAEHFSRVGRHKTRPGRRVIVGIEESAIGGGVRVLLARVRERFLRNDAEPNAAEFTSNVILLATIRANRVRCTFSFSFVRRTECKTNRSGSERVRKSAPRSIIISLAVTPVGACFNCTGARSSSSS